MVKPVSEAATPDLSGLSPLDQMRISEGIGEQEQPSPGTVARSMDSGQLTYGQVMSEAAAQERAFRADPYDPGLSGISFDDKEKIAEAYGVGYDRQQDLQQNYTQVQTGEYIPNTYFDELKRWAEENNVRYDNLEDALRRGGTHGLAVLTKQYVQAIEREMVEKQIREMNDPEMWNAYKRGGLPAIEELQRRRLQEFEDALSEQPEELQEAYREGGIERYMMKANQIREDWLDENIRSDAYLTSVLDRDGETAAVEAWQKRQDDIQGIMDRNYTKLPDGQYIRKSDLEQIREEAYPLYEKVLAEGYGPLEELSTLRVSDSNAYFNKLKEYGMVPEHSVLLGMSPDGELQIMQYAPEKYNREVYDLYGDAERNLITKMDSLREQYPDKTTEEIAQITENTPEYARFVEMENIIKDMPSDFDATVTGIKDFAVSLVPLTWIKDIDDMSWWQIALNAGLDAVALATLAGWGARLTGKAILKMGTNTLTKTLAKDIPAALTSVGETRLAAKSVLIARTTSKLDDLTKAVEKAAKAVAKAEKSGDTDAFLKAVAAEDTAKRQLSAAIRKLGTDIAVLDSQMADTALGVTGKAGLGRAVGMANKADDFASYIAGTQREVTRQGISRSLPSRVGQKLVSEVKAYLTIPQTIAETAKASVITATRGAKAGAAYLRGEGQAAKLGRTVGKNLTRSDMEKQVSKIESSLAATRRKAEERLARYQGKRTTLDKWDEYIRETWSPGGGGRTAARPYVPPSGGGGTAVATASTRTMTPEMAARYGGKVASTYQFPLVSLAGTRIGFVIVNPETGEVQVVSSPEKEIAPQIITVEGGEWPIVAPAKPFVAPATGEVLTEPLPSPVIDPEREKTLEFFAIDRPKSQMYPQVSPLVQTELKQATETSPAVATQPGTATQPYEEISTATGVSPLTGTDVATSQSPATAPAISPAPAQAVQPATQPAVATQPALRTSAATATQTATSPAVRPVPGMGTITTMIPKAVPMVLPDSDDEEEVRERIPNGSIAWAQGFIWYYIPPPWDMDAPIPLRTAPKGANNPTGTVPEETLQVIGKPRSRVPREIAIDIGAFDALVSDYGRRIQFSGHGVKTDVGTRVPSTTRGMAVNNEIGSSRHYNVSMGKSKSKSRGKRRPGTDATIGLVSRKYTDGI
jgi:hypothetical protein